MAASRDRRGNAGSKMAKLLNEEEEDEFYKTTYGGFEEVEDDKDYQSEDSDSDRVDSDFDIDENAEPEVEDNEEEEGKKRRRGGGVDTKAYKEPKKKEKAKDKKKKTKKGVKAMVDKGEGELEAKGVEAKPEERKAGRRKRKTDAEIAKELEEAPARKKVRASTTVKSAESDRKKREDAVRKKMMADLAAKKNVTAVRRLTQEELLEEAKETEKQNLLSLHEFQKLEMEKKKAARFSKMLRTGPMILFRSMTMPIVEINEDPVRPLTPPRSTSDSTVAGEAAPGRGQPEAIMAVMPEVTETKGEENEGKSEGSKEQKQETEKKKKKLLPENSCERSFITFQDLPSFKRAFPDYYYKLKGRTRTQNKIPERKYCPITGMLAKYFDPVTQTPYANLQAFKIIRETMDKQLEKQKKAEEKKADEKEKKKKSSASGGTPTTSRATTET